MSAMSLLQIRDYFYILAINNDNNRNNNKLQCVTAGRWVWGIKGQPIKEGSRAGMPET